MTRVTLGRPKSFTDGTRSWQGSSLRQAWPHEKPHIYKGKKGWVVRYMSFGRPVAGGPFIFFSSARLAAKYVWEQEYKEGKRAALQ
jgi:hypothetical protein